MHPVEHVLYLSSGAIRVILASHPVHFIFHLQSKVLQGPTSHAGFEKIIAGLNQTTGSPLEFFSTFPSTNGSALPRRYDRGTEAHSVKHEETRSHAKLMTTDVIRSYMAM
jgi:hypothetical protein